MTDEQKAALGKAAADYMPTLISGVSVAMAVKDTVQNASGMGAPGFRDGRAALSAAKDIPVLGPKIIKFLIDSAKTGKSLMSLTYQAGWVRIAGAGVMRSIIFVASLWLIAFGPITASAVVLRRI